MPVASLNGMPPKQLLFRSEARAKLLRGAPALADAVRITLGPRGNAKLGEVIQHLGPLGVRVPNGVIAVLLAAAGRLAFTGYLSCRELFARAPTTSRRLRRWVMAIILAITGPALADGDSDQRQDVVSIPAECAPYWFVPGGDDSPVGWNQVLSFAACVQDASIEQIEDPDQLPDLVEQLTERLSHVMPFYLAALERGPGPIQVRAAYQIGMAHLALLIRARASLIATADMRTSTKAAARYRELHARLEPLLARSARIALVSFVVVERAVATDRRLAPDAVTAYMVGSARQMANLLRRDWPDEPMREPLLASPP